MNYAFSKQKLPRGYSFPLKRSALDAALAAAGITQIHVVYYWFRKSGDIVLRADFCGAANVGWAAAGQSSITLYAVPRQERQATEEALLRDGLTRLCTWLRAAERAGNTWRGMDHAIIFSFTPGALDITTT